MNDFTNTGDPPGPSIFERIEKLEPYVALRLMILQIAVAAAVGFAASREIETLNPFFEGLSEPGTLFDLTALDRFGYPIRELVWSGEWWRVPLGLFLPPQWMLWGIACVGMFPFAKFLESRIGRGRSLAVYLLGASSVIYLDLLGYAGVTSGALGMVMAAGGASWVLLRFDGLRILSSGLEIPGAGWFVLFAIIPFAWIHSTLHLPIDPLSAGVTPLVPSWIALLASAITGMVFVLPFCLRSFELPFPEDEGESKPPWKSRLVGFLTGFWGVALVCYGLVSWLADSRIDYRVWKIEPGIQKGNSEALETLAHLIGRKPNDLFLKKRLAVHHLRRQDWSQALPILREVKESPSEGLDTLVDLKRRARLSRLNLRSSGQWLPWRFSGISGNYGTDRLRILHDLAHVARLTGNEKELSFLRGEILIEYGRMVETRIREIEKKVKENEKLREEAPTVEESFRVSRLRAQKLNGEAYILAELRGDLQVARSKAEQAVEDLNDPQVWDTLGWIEVLQGDFDSGAKHLENALFTQGSRPSGTIYYHLGVAYEGKGMEEEAHALFSQALFSDLEWWEEIDLKNRCPDCFDPLHSL